MNMLPRLDYIEFICTTVCNKRCKNCSNYIPQLGALQRHVSGEAFAEQLRILLSRVSYVEKMQIHGGEPLLNPDILQIIEELKKERDRIGKIRIITNGTVVLKETLIDALKGSRIQLAISNYLFNQESRKQIINQ